jgi:broad specificity phosphatase PhoE
MIYLVRHGETVWNREGRMQGHLDSPLTETGVAQATAIGRRLRLELPGDDDVAVVTSPLGRARQTALVLCGELGIAPHELVESALLMEHHLGSWSGLTHTETDRRFPGARQARRANHWAYVIPGGESYAMADERARRWLAEQRRAGITVAVTHEMISRNIQGAYAGLAPRQTLRLSHPQDRIYRLDNGRVEMLL